MPIGTPSRIVRNCIALCLACTTIVAADDRAPDRARDTLSPVYDWKTLPYGWDRLRAGEFPLTPVRWTRSPANPVVARGMNSRPVQEPDGTVRVWYGNRGAGQGIFRFDVDPSSPEKLLAAPVGPLITTGPKGSYDDDWVLAPEPVRLSDSHLRMYYSAKRTGGFFQKVWTLAVADSLDGGRTWRKHAGNPILSPTDDPWECGAVGFCSVERNEAGWKMWYLGTNDKSDALKQVGYATSSDGLDWKRHADNPVIAVNRALRWEAGAIAVPRVVKDGELYKVWYCCYEHNDTYAVGQAESFDGLRWFRSPHNPVLKGSGSGFDAKMTAYPGTIRVGARYLMWYSGDGYGSKGIGLATADAPRGRWLFRTGPAEKPDAKWSAWQPLGEQEPPREGWIQFAVLTEERADRTVEPQRVP